MGAASARQSGSRATGGRLKALAVPDNPWHAFAEEQLALLDLRLGKRDEAKTALSRLAAGHHGSEWRA